MSDSPMFDAEPAPAPVQALTPEAVEMIRRYRHLMWIVPVTLVFLAIIMANLPNSIVSKSKPLRTVKKKILKFWKRSLELTQMGPMYKISVWAGKCCSAGWLSSTCLAPTHVRAETQSFNEVFFWWKPNYPRFNPFHEETYVCQWQLVDPQEGEDKGWHAKEFNVGDFEQDGYKLKLAVEALPENKLIRFRIAGVNKRGKGEWSKTCEARTFARPDDQGGFWGPLGPAKRHLAEDRQKYTWTQMRGEIAVKVPINDDWKRDNISFNKTPVKLEISYVDGSGNSELLLGGKFPQRAKIDEIFWQIETTKEEGRHLQITMTKDNPLEQWAHVFEGDEHPSIDKKHVRLLTDGMDDNIDWLKENVQTGQPRDMKLADKAT
eukprot:TRINITY_DN13153_c0_g1_i1.p1 TRINITY_DN13153_c0_g1~~TRINITY_DN13153_c0_g1_i1.p1  ORF type:complete len:377 (+),score=103.44 TRINITY_DN13153_c0_g1_i1:158-1288(+)